MKKTILFLCCIMNIGFLSAERLRAFPEAEGFGAYTTGGRGGRVIYVTHTKDAIDTQERNYNGSLRAALNTPGNDPITIVFRCSGAIELQGQINSPRSNMTIAGQTALGGGICVGQYGVKFTGNNLIIRYMRFRPSDKIPQNNPALEICNNSRIIIDHCSMSWSVEENSNITDCDSITVQWCFNTESLYNAGHDKGARAYAAQWGGQHASYHHNLLAHHNNRMPRQNGNTSNDYQLTWDYRNNVHFNWGSDGAFYGGGVEQAGGFSHSNLIGNYYIPGPATTTTKNNQYFCAPSGGRPAVVGEGIEMFKFGAGKWWLEGNIMEGNDSKTSNNFSGLNPYEAVSKAGLSVDTFNAKQEFAIAVEFMVTTTSAEQAYTDVITKAGARLQDQKLDFVDSCVLADVVNRRAVRYGTFIRNGVKVGTGILDSPFDISGSAYKPRSASLTWGFKNLYTAVDSTNAPADSDRDGMPDWWEVANGLNPNDATDRNTVHASGYTMLEVFLNTMPVMPTNIFKIAHTEEMPYLKVYPSPVMSHFSIETILEPKVVEIYSLIGTRVASYPANAQNEFSATLLNKGVYIVKVIFTNGKFATKQIIK